VRANPEYVPDPADTSPRVMELFREARRARLPDVLREAYAAGKAAMDGQDLEGAIRQFELVVRLAAEAEIAADSTIRDLNVLAGGFLELARARMEAAKPAPVDPPEPETTPDPTETGAQTAGVAPAPLITPAVPIEQALPPWVAPDAASRSWDFSGAVRVEIGGDGRVTSATMEKPVHPSYDARLLAAAKGWTYQPARLNGVPVSSSLTVRVVLKPR
jgi:TonB family protein